MLLLISLLCAYIQNAYIVTLRKKYLPKVAKVFSVRFFMNSDVLLQDNGQHSILFQHYVQSLKLLCRKGTFWPCSGHFWKGLHGVIPSEADPARASWWNLINEIKPSAHVLQTGFTLQALQQRTGALGCAVTCSVAACQPGNTAVFDNLYRWIGIGDVERLQKH